MKNVKFRKSIHSPEHVKLRKFWKEKRERLGLSQRGFAKKYNYDYSLVSRIERGDRRLDTVETLEYCQALEVDPVEVIKLFSDD